MFVFLSADLTSMLSDLPVSDRRAPGCEKKSLEMAAQQNLTPFDYEQKKLLATKAMQNKSSNNDFRVPTSAWSGYGLSQSIPPITTSDLSKVIIRSFGHIKSNQIVISPKFTKVKFIKDIWYYIDICGFIDI